MTAPGDAGRATLLAALSAAPGRLGEMAFGAAAVDADADEAWSPAEVVRHLIACERDVFQGRLAQLAADGNEPHWPWVEPGPDEASAGRPLGELLAAFSAARAETLARAAALDETGWARAGIHAALGRLDVAGLLGVVREHDEDHLADLASRRDSPRTQL